jgi:voltage-gated potassium channel
MAQRPAPPRRRSNAYNLFILVLTIFSLVIMVVMFLPLNDATIGLLQFYDILICLFFLIDFLLNLRKASKKSDYFIKQRGWLDLLGSIPSFGVTFKYAGLFRLARLSRLARIRGVMRGQRREDLAQDVGENRSSYTGFITILLAIIVLASASVLVLQFESGSPEAKIITGWDAFWYSIVTITTVGYGDYYPVTFWGRVTAMFIMVAGVGIISVLASLLSSVLIGSRSAPAEEETPDAAPALPVEQELAIIKNELAVLRQLMERMSTEREHERTSRDPPGSRS